MWEIQDALEKNFYESNITNTALIVGCAFFCVYIFTPHPVLNIVRKIPVRSNATEEERPVSAP